MAVFQNWSSRVPALPEMLVVLQKPDAEPHSASPVAYINLIRWCSTFALIATIAFPLSASAQTNAERELKTAQQLGAKDDANR